MQKKESRLLGLVLVPGRYVTQCELVERVEGLEL